ncbi:hypothetical protein [Mesorhizobium retamae]|uniref:Uncharacterized protein n=1 Tax=Mesorhizobium retamae TaxID=2912854 RepID=A0ABS9QP70_9HYPH|nr:hypothetical protein [Mesorhizobium sp. IRAMC:0171]MCG7509243.1 hypothetical protein [Mesorhizobium sp. IRAMC:0171]
MIGQRSVSRGLSPLPCLGPEATIAREGEEPRPLQEGAIVLMDENDSKCTIAVDYSADVDKIYSFAANEGCKDFNDLATKFQLENLLSCTYIGFYESGTDDGKWSFVLRIMKKVVSTDPILFENIKGLNVGAKIIRPGVMLKRLRLDGDAMTMRKSLSTVWVKTFNGEEMLPEEERLR